MKRLFVILTFLTWTLMIHSQDESGEITGTFRSTRLLNGHTIQMVEPGIMDFRVSHRFGRLNSGAYEFFGLDQANIHLGLDFGITKWFMAGIGRGAYEKTYDAFTKFSLLRQSAGERNVPLSISVFGSMAYKTVKPPESEPDYTFSERASYTAQVIIARKMNKLLSLQLIPGVIYRNFDGTDPSLLWSAGAGGSVRVSERISLNAGYYLCFNKGTYNYSTVYDPFSIGIDVETSGHVFQLILTNSQPIIEKGFIGETTGSWGKGDIHLGFNISRYFGLKK